MDVGGLFLEFCVGPKVEAVFVEVEAAAGGGEEEFLRVGALAFLYVEKALVEIAAGEAGACARAQGFEGVTE